MNITSIEYIESISRVLNENGLTRIDVTDKGAHIAVERTVAAVEPMPFAPVATPTTVGAELVSARNTSTSARSTAAEAASPTPALSALTEIKAPIVGVFYSSSSPEAEPFVKVGDAVKKGDVLCIIEAMKFLNEITAETDGTVAEICAKNGDVVEFGQVILKIS